MSRPTPEFDFSEASQERVQESALVMHLALDLRRLGTDEDVLWAQELTKEMPRYGDAGPSWWAEKVQERLAEIARR